MSETETRQGFVPIKLDGGRLRSGFAREFANHIEALCRAGVSEAKRAISGGN